MTTIPTLPSAYEAPTQCMTSTNIWRWIIAGNSQYGVLGSPEQTDSCFPPSYNPTGYFSASACPEGYTSACGQEVGTQEATTCCPVAFQFVCGSEAAPTLSTLRCVTSHTRAISWTVTVTDLTASTRYTTFMTNPSGGALHAYAIQVVKNLAAAPTSFTTSSTSTSASTTPSQSSAGPSFTTSPTTLSTDSSRSSSDTKTTSTTGIASETSATTSKAESSESSSVAEPSTSGLSTGQSAGVGVGAGLGAVLLVFLLWWIYRRWNRRTKQQSVPAIQQSEKQIGSARPVELDTLHPHGYGVNELHGQAVSELPAYRS